MKGGVSVDVNVILGAVGSIGFPIVACICCGWFIKYLLDKNAEEMKSVKEAINNNTLVIQKLVDKLDCDDGK